MPMVTKLRETKSNRNFKVEIDIQTSICKTWKYKTKMHHLQVAIYTLGKRFKFTLFYLTSYVYIYANAKLVYLEHINPYT